MLARVHATIRTHTLLLPGQSVLVGLSGGPDSWALVLALQKLSQRLGIGIQAAYVDHGLRPSSGSEAEAVRGVCEQRGIPCAIVKVDVQAQRVRHVSLQDAARRARLDGLARLARASGCEVVALGHTADDQAETILFRIVRGTGIKGLQGIPYRRDVFVRPLLDVHRAQVEAFVKRAKIEPVRDPSNADPRFARARVRHEWFPLLSKENPRLVEALVSLGSHARQVPQIATPAEIHDEQGAPVWISRRAAAVVTRLKAGRTCGEVAVPGGRVEIAYGRAVFRQATADSPVPAREVTQSACAAGVKALLTEKTAALNLALTTAQKPMSDVHKSTFDADAVVWPLTIRTWKAGDRMRLRGANGSRKLQNLFVDAKVPRSTRHTLPVLIDAQGVILFVPGFRPSSYGQPKPATTRWLEVWSDNLS